MSVWNKNTFSFLSQPKTTLSQVESYFHIFSHFTYLSFIVNVSQLHSL